MIKPGEFVDVYMTTDAGGGSSPLQSGGGSAGDRSGMTVTLFKGVKVVAVNRSGSAGTSLQGGGESQSVTLELDEDQARIMLLAQQKGRIALTYNPNGPGTGGINIKTENDRVTVEQLLGLSKVAEPKKPFKTENYRGSGHNSSYWRDGERIDYQGSDSSDSISMPLQRSADGWETNTKPPTSNDLTRQPQPAVSGTL